ncbi:MAG TPA: ROK family protein [Steroidobacteraceae bacterium]|nr:ROK family protein [Steroidobacteraceae bacterium]HRX90376.1 ROK family protein [Steroidobacteraceae bacterium]
MNRHAIGIDIGGSSIKCALVDLDKGQLAGERRTTSTPAMSAAQDMYAAIASVLPPDTGALAAGLAFPGVIKAGVVKTAAHIAKSWLDHPLTKTAAAHLDRDVVALNDADAAGLAEMRYGAGRDAGGTALVLTLGTGIGSALFVDGHLVPNTELGHLEVDGIEAELRAAARIRVEQELDWSSWLRALELVINRMHSLLWPDLVVLCGGITSDHPQLARELACHCPIKVGELRADAGLVGAALATTLSRGAWLRPQVAQP